MTRLTLFTLAALCLMWSLSGRGAQAQHTLTPQERRGKQIYLKGEGAGGEIIAVLGAGDLELPATSFTCSNCHGLWGEGSREGGIQPSPVRWEVLSTSRKSPLTGRVRPPYDEASLERAIRTGIAPGGGRLHPGMPRYKMTPGQMSDLIAYLKRIGKPEDEETGLTDGFIKIGTALPLSGSLAGLGEDVKATLGAYFAEVNLQGGIYGRKIELVVEDSRGEPAGTAEATRLLIERHGVFALVASFEPAESDAANELISKAEVPLIGPVTLSPVLPPVPNRYVFYLLPSFRDQARALIDYLRMKPLEGSERIAIVNSGRAFDRDAAAGVRSQAKLYSMNVVSELQYDPGRFRAETVALNLSQKRPDYIFFFGDADDILALAGELHRLKVEAHLLSSAIMIARRAFNLPAPIASRTLLSFPASLPGKDDFTEFLSLMQRSSTPVRSAGFQAVAFAAAKALVEAAKMPGRKINRTELVNAMEQLRNFKTGVVAPISFGPNRRVGATGSYVVGIDVANRNYIVLSERIVPKD